MTNTFDAIVEDFSKELNVISSLVQTFDTKQPPNIRIAAANSATLLLAATFEEFIREMAREYARTVVSQASSFTELPKDLVATAWKRTMAGLAKIKFDGQKSLGVDLIIAAQARFAVIYEFCKGDLSQDIYRELIHNEMNMRPSQINSLFKVSGLGDVCTKCSGQPAMLDAFGQSDTGKTHGKFLTAMEDFFERRNSIAHGLRFATSSAPEQINSDIHMLRSFAQALKIVLSTASVQD